MALQDILQLFIAHRVRSIARAGDVEDSYLCAGLDFAAELSEQLQAATQPAAIAGVQSPVLVEVSAINSQRALISSTRFINDDAWTTTSASLALIMSLGKWLVLWRCTAAVDKTAREVSNTARIDW